VYRVWLEGRLEGNSLHLKGRLSRTVVEHARKLCIALIRPCVGEDIISSLDGLTKIVQPFVCSKDFF
jgi:hypothetical protein